MEGATTKNVFIKILLSSELVNQDKQKYPWNVNPDKIVTSFKKNIPIEVAATISFIQTTKHYIFITNS